MDLGLDYFGPWVLVSSRLCNQDRAMAGRGDWGKPPGPSGLYRTLRLALASAGYKSEISLKVPHWQLKLNVRVTGLLSADHEQHGPGCACMPGAAPQNPPRPRRPGRIRHSGCHAHASGSDPIYLPAQARARRVWQARPAARQGHPSTVIGPAAQRALARGTMAMPRPPALSEPRNAAAASAARFCGLPVGNCPATGVEPRRRRDDRGMMA